METRPRILLIAALCSLCAACGGDNGDAEGGHALDAQQQALERAQSVEDDVAAAAQRQRDRIEDAEDGGNGG